MAPQQCWHFLALVAYSLKPVKPLGPYNRTQHCWSTTHNSVVTCCIRLHGPLIVTHSTAVKWCDIISRYFHTNLTVFSPTRGYYFKNNLLLQFTLCKYTKENSWSNQRLIEIMIIQRGSLKSFSWRRVRCISAICLSEAAGLVGNIFTGKAR